MSRRVTVTRRIVVMGIIDATMQCLALLGGAFYSINVSSPSLTIGTLADPTFHMFDAARYATLRTSDPDPYLTRAIVSFVATLPSLGPSWR
jgi:hypothetical protein